MKGRRLLSYILALTLFAAPAYGQIIPRSGAGAGGGGGGDASAANQTTQISALPLEDTASADADRLHGLAHVRRDTLVADGGVTADGDYMHSYADNRGSQWVHNAPLDQQIELHAAASTTGDGTTIDVSGINLLLVHATTSAGWDRTSSFNFQGALGGGALSAFRTLPYLEFQSTDGASATAPLGRFDASATLAATASHQQGYLIDVRGLQTFKAAITVTGGTTGTVEVHAHAVKNGEGVFNSAMTLVQTSNNLGGVSDFSVKVAGMDPGANAGSQTTLPVARTGSDALAGGDRGIPIHAVNNSDASTLEATEDRYMPIAADDAGYVIVASAHSPHIPTNRSIGKLEDTTHADGDAGVPTWGTHNEALASYATTAGDYVPEARERTGVGINTLIYGNLAAGTQIGKLEDSPSGNGHAGIPAFAVRNDGAATSFGGANGDYTWIAVTEQGETFKASSGSNFFAITDAAIAAASQNFAFGFTSKKVMVTAPSGNGADLCVDWGGGTAVCPALNTAGDDLIKAGESIILDDFKGTSISAISASGTIEITVRAWN